jgi:hypothetical protein
MELSFRTRKLRAVCEDECKAASTLGEAVAKQLRHRLADLRAATTVADLVTGQTRFGGRQNSQMRLHIADGVQLLCHPNTARLPKDDGGMVDWGRVYRLAIVAIEVRS